MANKKINMKKELLAQRFKFDLMQRVSCTEDESKEYRQLLADGGTLPKDVYSYVDVTTSMTMFYRVYEAELTEAEKSEYIAYKQLGYLKTIKNCCVFFTTITLIGMIAYLAFFLSSL